MTNKNDGGSAFPVPGLSDLPNGQFLYPLAGMSLRDYFAAKAMQGWLSSYGPGDKHPASCGACAFVANQAYTMADAMLASRERT